MASADIFFALDVHEAPTYNTIRELLSVLFSAASLMEELILMRSMSEENIIFPDSNSGLILVIQDDDAVRDALTLVLRSWGFSVAPYSSLKICCQSFKLSPFNPDLIVSDLQFWQSSCENTLRHLMNFVGTICFSGPVIIMTGDSAEKSRQTIEASGWIFLLKPVPIHSLRKIVLDSLGDA